MYIYKCDLEIHDNLYFSSKEYGALYECEHYIHNYALTYALAFALSDHDKLKKFLPLNNYYCSSDKKTASYKEDLEPLNNHFYVTPAKPINYEMDINSINCGDEDNFIKFGIKNQGFGQNLRRSFNLGDKRNKPGYSKVKEVSVESEFLFFIICKENIEFDSLIWLRLGKWMSKAEVNLSKIENKDIKFKSGRYISSCTLNKNDVEDMKYINFDLISMPPSSLISNATIEGEYIEFGDEKNKVCLPHDLKYRF